MFVSLFLKFYDKIVNYLIIEHNFVCPAMIFLSKEILSTLNFLCITRLLLKIHKLRTPTEECLIICQFEMKM